MLAQFGAEGVEHTWCLIDAGTPLIIIILFDDMIPTVVKIGDLTLSE